MKRILFVDDEPRVLQGLERMLYTMEREWEMRFAASGHEALEMLSQKPADVAISDMRMPNMNGAELLNEVMRRYPKTVRLILSGYGDEVLVMQCIGATHQFLSKPCQGDTLRSVISRAMETARWVDSDRIKTLVAGMKTVPSLPELYLQILKELRSSEAGLDHVGATIAQDPAMTAKILQLTNSAFFGLRRHLVDPTEAVVQLGLETIKSLVLTLHVFSQFESAGKLSGDVEKIYHHSLATAMTAKRIAHFENQDNAVIEECFTAGLLHDIGRLALAGNLPEQYSEALVRAARESIPLPEAERAVFGASHAEVGGYLLGLWGLPIVIVEAAIFHHTPNTCQTKVFSPLTAVHVANVLEQNAAADKPAWPGSQLDREYLEKAGVWERVAVWREAVKQNAA